MSTLHLVRPSWLGLAFVLLSCSLLGGECPAQKKTFELPKPPKVLQGAEKTGELVLPEGRKNGSAQRAPKTAGSAAASTLGIFIESLSGKEKLGLEELVAEYSLLSEADQLQLLRRIPQLKRVAIGRLARTYARLPEARALAGLLRALRTKKLGVETRTVVEAVLTLAGARQKDIAFDLLEQKHRLVREAAQDELAKRLEKSDLPRIEKLLRSRVQGTRLAALRVVGTWYRNESVQRPELLLRALDHSDGSCRSLAATLLHRYKLDVVPFLEKRLAGTREEPGFYLAAVLLASLELRRDKDLLDKRFLPYLLVARESADPFHRAASAITRGIRRFRHPEESAGAENPLVAKAEQRALFEDLVGVVDVKSFYPEFPICHDLASIILELLSGEDFGNDRLRWKAWLETAREGFRPFARTVPMEAEALEKGRLVLRIAGEAQFSILGPEAEERADDGSRFRLIAKDFAALLAKLRQRAFLDLGSRLSGGARIEELSLTIEAGGKRARDAFSNERNPRYLMLAKPLQACVDREYWQEFAPTKMNESGRIVWWAKERERFQMLKDPAKRRSHLLELCSSSLPDFGPEKRRRALGLLLEEGAKPGGRLDMGIAKQLFEVLGQPGLSIEERRSVFEILAMVKDERVFAPIFAALRKVEDAEVPALLGRVLAIAGSARVVVAMHDESAKIRAAAARQLSSLRYREAFPELLKLLEDKDSQVVTAAIESCGRLSIREALPDLLALAKSKDPEIRRAALVSLGAVGGVGALSALLDATSLGDAADRLAAVRGMTLLEGPRSSAALVGILTAHYPGALGLLALQGLQQRGGPALRARVRRSFLAAGKRDLKFELLLLLGEMQDPDAFPALLEQLAVSNARRARILRLLTGICGVDHTKQPDALSRYREWYRQHGREDPAMWMLQACAAEKLTTTLRRSQLLPGAGNAVIEELCRLLVKARRWPTRALVNFELREITGEDFGKVDSATSFGAVEAIAERFRALARATAGGGK